MADDHPLAQSALREVVDLHAFFETWLGGTAPDTEAAFSRLENALAENFSMVSPDGARLGRDEVIGRLRRANGVKNAPGPFRIAITEPEPLLVQPPVVLLRYVEEQTTGDALTRRRSTALLEAAPDLAAGLRWLALHETWIAPGP